MPGSTIETFNGNFIYYLPGVIPTLNDAVTFINLASKNTRKWTGEHIEFHIHTARSHALGYSEDGGAFPPPDKQDLQKVRAFRRFLHASVQITDGNLANAKDDSHAAEEITTLELGRMIEGATKFQNYFGFRDGTGVVGTLGTDISGTTWGATDARLLWDGQTYEIRDQNDITSLKGTVTVVSVARGLDGNGDRAVTSTAALPATSAAGDFIVWPNASNRAVTGLEALIDDSPTTFQNINTVQFPRYTSPVLSNGGTDRALSPTLFRQMLAMIWQESGKDPNKKLHVLGTPWAGIEWEELYEPELRITPDTKTAGASISSFQSSYGKIHLTNERDAPNKKLFFSDFSQIFRAEQLPLQWRDDGSGPLKMSQQSGVWRATAIEICEYYIEQRNRCGRIDDLAEVVTTAY
jgi:hypothetical protein